MPVWSISPGLWSSPGQSARAARSLKARRSRATVCRPLQEIEFKPGACRPRAANAPAAGQPIENDQSEPAAAVRARVDGADAISRSGIADLNTDPVARLDRDLDLIVGGQSGMADAVGHEFGEQERDRRPDVRVESVKPIVIEPGPGLRRGARIGAQRPDERATAHRCSPRRRSQPRTRFAIRASAASPSVRGTTLVRRRADAGDPDARGRPAASRVVGRAPAASAPAPFIRRARGQIRTLPSAPRRRSRGVPDGWHAPARV
jgi:hypothetical protein